MNGALGTHQVLGVIVDAILSAAVGHRDSLRAARRRCHATSLVVRDTVGVAGSDPLGNLNEVASTTSSWFLGSLTEPARPDLNRREPAVAWCSTRAGGLLETMVHLRGAPGLLGADRNPAGAARRAMAEEVLGTRRALSVRACRRWASGSRGVSRALCSPSLWSQTVPPSTITLSTLMRYRGVPTDQPTRHGLDAAPKGCR